MKNDKIYFTRVQKCFSEYILIISSELSGQWEKIFHFEVTKCCYVFDLKVSHYFQITAFVAIAFACLQFAGI